MKWNASLVRITFTQSHSMTLSFLHSKSHWQWGQIFVIVTALHRTILLQDLAAGDAVGESMKWDMTKTFSPKAAKSVSHRQVFWLIPAPETFPSSPVWTGSRDSGVIFRSHMAEMMAGTYSSGNCCRFSRHSLLILPGMTGDMKPMNGVNVMNLCWKPGKKVLTKSCWYPDHIFFSPVNLCCRETNFVGLQTSQRINH